MNFFEETFWFIKKLFTKVKPVDKIEIVPMRFYPFKSAKYLMWCGSLVCHKSDTQSQILDTDDENHERIHIAQATDCGSWVVFYLRYLWNWFKIIDFSGKNIGYYTCKYEVEAYAKEEDLTYLSRRQKHAENLFKLEPSRRKYFKKFRTRYAYKQSIKEKFKNI